MDLASIVGPAVLEEEWTEEDSEDPLGPDDQGVDGVNRGATSVDGARKWATWTREEDDKVAKVNTLHVLPRPANCEIRAFFSCSRSLSRVLAPKNGHYCSSSCPGGQGSNAGRGGRTT